MKSPSYYTRKAAACRELGRWDGADQWAAMAAKARRARKKVERRPCERCENEPNQ